MKVIIEQEDLVFYSVTDDYKEFSGKVTELSDKDRCEYQEVMARFWNMQAKLKSLYKV